ncbi:transmembrane amino acid transporter protein-domain-containing protein [Melanogaster broomeanus]|nr:transmembrane amino acid transporter protein-domain-containing protein [Melanogaster broomeanus]
MTSLPTSIPYGSASSSYSVRDAFISYRRSQYYASSIVQPPDLSESDDDLPQTSEHARSCVSNTWAERHDQHKRVPEYPWDSPRTLGNSTVTRPSGRETTPLLRKAVSFTPYSHRRPAPVSHIDYRSSSLPEIASSSSLTSHQASSAPVVQYHHDGKSTYGQTLFNCIAVLLGIGMLSEPLAFAYAGWFWGTVLIIFFGIITCYTSKLLAREMLLDRRLRSYADIGRKAFGPRSSLLTNSLFCLELFSVGVVLVTLAADSLHGVWPTYSANTYKIFSLFVLAPTVFLPLSILSFPSLLGISSTLVVMVVIFIDGLSKPDSPGSLWSPAQTSWSPGTLREVGVSFGLLMAGFSGHVVIPSLARDMIDPSQFNHMANWAFTITTLIYAIIGYVGYLMFGLSVSDEISKDLLTTPGYNFTLNQLAMWLLLNIILEIMLGLESAIQPRSVEDGKGTISPKSHRLTKQFLAATERVMAVVMSVAVSILVPEFSALMAFLGSFSAFVICVIGPISAKIALTGRCQWYDAALLGISVVMAVWGTFSAFWTV